MTIYENATYISLLEELKKEFPNKLPSRDEDHSEVTIARLIGQQEIIAYLESRLL